MVRLMQVLKEYAGRTEYKVLQKWLSLRENAVEDLEQGGCVVPGILLSKISRAELTCLVSWSQEWGNQLILTPPWWNVDVGLLLGLEFKVLVEEKETSFQEIPVSYTIKSKLNARWKTEASETVSLDIKRDSGSGLVSVTTVPLLDYRLLHLDRSLKELFMQLVCVPEEDETPKADVKTQVQAQDSLTVYQLYTLLLAAGGIDIRFGLQDNIKHYLAVSVKTMDEDGIRSFLVDQGYLEPGGAITGSGLGLLQKTGYRAFIREIKKRGEGDVWY